MERSTHTIADTCVIRRKSAQEAAREARRRLYAATKAIDEAIRACTRQVAARPAPEWPDVVRNFEAAVQPYIDAADGLPPAPHPLED